LYKISPKTLFVGKNVRYFSNCYSTNDVAAEIIQQKEAFEGAFIITDNQLAGRGQRGNHWEAHPGMNITLSVLLKPSFLQANKQFDLNVAVSLAIHDLLSSQKLDKLTIKWPNDIYVGNKKMGGILIENMLSGNYIGWSIIGVGLNVNQLDFENLNATSLRIEMKGKEQDNQNLIEKLAEYVEKRFLELKAGKADSQKKTYVESLFRFEEWHTYKVNGKPFAGQIIDVSPTGRLIVKTLKTVENYDFKEISYVI
jgi:BirA family biotin operon repressor/biotin-[acetyl-CoA-carboxylase] ligase